MTGALLMQKRSLLRRPSGEACRPALAPVEWTIRPDCNQQRAEVEGAHAWPHVAREYEGETSKEQ